MLRSKIALVSVSNKTGLDAFAGKLAGLGWSIVASPGTARFLRSAGILVGTMEDLTGIPVILGHRVFSEHIKIAGALVAEATEEHDQDRLRHDIPWFDLACVDLYPLERAVAEAKNEADVVNSTDIGGVTLVRNAVKGRRVVITDLADCKLVTDYLEREGDVPDSVRRTLWYKAEAHCARYCLESAKFLAAGAADGLIGRRTRDLRYGENPYQADAAYYQTSDGVLALHRFQQASGYNPGLVNMTSLSSLVQALTRLHLVFARNCGGRAPYAAIGAKHGIPVGAAIDWVSGDTALRKMLWSSPRTIWGGEVITNFALSEANAAVLLSDERRRERCGSAHWMLDVVAAPGWSEGAARLLGKSDKRRVFLNPALTNPSFESEYVYRFVQGGFIRQPSPDYILDLKAVEWCGEPVTGADLDTLFLVWAIAWSMHMNGIALAADRQLLASDGQPSSVEAVQSCVTKMQDNGHDGRNIFAANAFLPFEDSARILAEHGASAGILPRGGTRHNDVCNFLTSRGIPLALVPEQFRGFAHH